MNPEGIIGFTRFFFICPLFKKTGGSKRYVNFCNFSWNISAQSKIIFKIGVLTNFANFTGTYLYWIFLIKLQAWGPATLLKRDSNTDLNFIKKRPQHRCFPVKLRNFQEYLILQKTSGSCFCVSGIPFSLVLLWTL